MTARPDAAEASSLARLANLEVRDARCSAALQELCNGGSLRDLVYQQMNRYNKVQHLARCVSARSPAELCRAAPAVRCRRMQTFSAAMHCGTCRRRSCVQRWYEQASLYPRSGRRQALWPIDSEHVGC